MAYHIYENWVAEKKAVIHEGNCKFCNHGKGCHENILGNRNGKWHGPFESFSKTEEVAKFLKDRILKIHSCCKI